MLLYMRIWTSRFLSWLSYAFQFNDEHIIGIGRVNFSTGCVVEKFTPYIILLQCLLYNKDCYLIRLYICLSILYHGTQYGMLAQYFMPVSQRRFKRQCYAKRSNNWFSTWNVFFSLSKAGMGKEFQNLFVLLNISHYIGLIVKW